MAAVADDCECDGDVTPRKAVVPAGVGERRYALVVNVDRQSKARNREPAGRALRRNRWDELETGRGRSAFFDLIPEVAVRPDLQITYVALQLVELSGQLLDSRRQLLDDDSDLLHGTVAALRPTSALLALDSIPVIAIARLLSRSPWIPFDAMPGVATKERGPALVSKQMA
jgi:hypothetical protein